MTLRARRLKVGPVALQQLGQRAEIPRHATQDQVLVEAARRRELDSPVKRALPLADLRENLHDLGLCKMAFQDRTAKPRPCDINFRGQTELLYPGQERNLRHLGQVHPDRVVRVARNLIEFFRAQLNVIDRVKTAAVAIVIEIIDLGRVSDAIFGEQWGFVFAVCGKRITCGRQLNLIQIIGEPASDLALFWRSPALC